MKRVFSKFTTAFLAVLMLVSMVPTMSLTASAAVTGGKFENAQLDIVSDKNSTLAPGVTENQYTVYDKNGDQVKMFVATADMSVDSVKLFASYNNMDPTYFSMSKLTEQVAAFNKKAEAGDPYYQGTVVAGINASYYNMTTGQPTGIFVMNGVVGTASESAGYFAVMKDGSMKIGVKGDYAKDAGNIQEAIGIYQMLIVDGEICSGLDAKTKYPRQTIGITADNKLIIMSADGNQAPTSVGLTILEQAQVMKDLGCVWAGHLDGGGSMTYGSKAEGSDEFKITNNPSDGSERSVSNGFIIVSTAATSYEFDHVIYNVENDYVTPGTSVKVDVTGTSSTGNAADIPDDITYEVVNGTYVDGVFTAGNTVGDATITAMYNGKAAGTVTVNVVNPDIVSFAQSEMVVPYGKTVPLNISATYGLHEVKIKADDFSIVLSDATIGSVSGFSFSACEESSGVIGGIVTATLVVDSTVSAATNITFGKGSEVVMDFENASLGNLSIITGYPQYGPSGANGQNEVGKLEIVTAENGKVHDGNYSLAVECDFSQAYETGYHMLKMNGLNITVPTNAQTIGMWMYMPELEELMTTSCRIVGKTASGTGVSSPWLWDNCTPYGWTNDGWRYVTMDLTGYNEEITFTYMEFYICDRDNSSVDFWFADNASVNGRFTYYIDNVTVDYSSAVDDREPPIFENVKYAEVGMAEGATLNGNTVSSNTLDFFANVKEDTTKNNYTGLNASSAKAYIDGVEVKNSYTNGVISVVGAVLADGVHTVCFEISDNMGNMSYITRQITVNAGSGMTNVSLVPDVPDATKILIGSLYWMNLNTTNVENIDSVSMNLNLNSMSQWELDNIETAAGFTASYEYDYVTNNAVVTITRTGNVKATGAATIAKLPIRTWESRLTEYSGYEDQTPAKLWSRKIIWPVDIKLSMNMGAINFADGTTGSFSMTPIEVITELYGNYKELNANGDYSNKTSWHIHTAEAIADKAATCTEDGYTGRTFCAGCNSIVDFETKIPATGHNYTVVEGVLKCACGELFNGVYTDGKTYVDGVCQTDGWVGDSCYKDGVKLTGVQLVDGYYYNFGDDGICVNKIKYTGLFYDDEVSAWRYSKLGELAGGWQQIVDDWYYFESLYMYAVAGTYKVGKATFTFNEQGMTKGAWYTTEEGTRFYYGPSCYRAYNPGYMKFIKIEGVTYNFDYDGYVTPGVWALRDSTAHYKRVFEFAEDGSLIKEFKEAGAVVCEDAIYFINSEGVVPLNSEGTGIMKDGKDYYYVLPSGKVAQNSTRWVTAKLSNGLVSPGEYTFGADGKMEKPYTGIKNVNGVDYYYLEGNVMTNNTGLLVKVGDDIYYVTPMGKIKKDFTMWITATKANSLVSPGEYTFGTDGKMEIPYTGIKNVDGVDYYYVNGAVDSTGSAHLIKVGDDIYYVTPMGKIKKNFTMWINEAKANGLVVPGEYTFDENGKMIIS